MKGNLQSGIRKAINIFSCFRGMDELPHDWGKISTQFFTGNSCTDRVTTSFFSYLVGNVDVLGMMLVMVDLKSLLANLGLKGCMRTNFHMTFQNREAK